jgi:hypothetical protein
MRGLIFPLVRALPRTKIFLYLFYYPSAKVLETSDSRSTCLELLLLVVIQFVLTLRTAFSYLHLLSYWLLTRSFASQAFLDNRKSHEAKDLERPHTTAALLTLCGVSSIAINQVGKATVIGQAFASSD